jgi:outer membrane protein TolC
MIARAGIVLAALASAGAPARAETWEPQGDLTFERAIQLALAHNERSRIADLDIEVAEAGVMKARAAFLPALTATGSDTYSPLDKAP